MAKQDISLGYVLEKSFPGIVYVLRDGPIGDAQYSKGYYFIDGNDSFVGNGPYPSIPEAIDARIASLQTVA